MVLDLFNSADQKKLEQLSWSQRYYPLYFGKNSWNVSEDQKKKKSFHCEYVSQKKVNHLFWEFHASKPFSPSFLSIKIKSYCIVATYPKRLGQPDRGRDPRIEKHWFKVNAFILFILFIKVNANFILVFA